MSRILLRGITIGMIVALLVVGTLLREALGGWFGYGLLALLALAGGALLAETVGRAMERVQLRLAQQNAELLALHEAGLSVTAELDLEFVLQAVVDRARALVGAQYGALSLLRSGGGIESFLTSGISAEEGTRIGMLPTGRGLLGVSLKEGQRLRLQDLGADPRSVGFPPNHPEMHSLLVVPILFRGGVLGNLYLTEKRGAAGFSQEDEETLVRFATQAAVAIGNARLHREVQTLAVTQERERIAREMHDSLAQVLGYVNTKAGAAQELLKSGRAEVAADHLGQLAEAARAAYADVREGILGLRISLGAERPLNEALAAYVEQWQETSGIAVELSGGWPADMAHLHPAAEVQLIRIVQEALTNVRKHAGASRVALRLSAVDEAIEAEVADNGIGFDPGGLGRGTLPRFGLATMRERAEAVNGSLEVVSAPGSGTRIVARIPTGTNQAKE